MIPQPEVTFKVENRDYLSLQVHRCCVFHVIEMGYLSLKLDFEEELCTFFYFLPHLHLTPAFIN